MLYKTHTLYNSYLILFSFEKKHLMILHDSSWKQQNPPIFFLKTCEQGTLRSLWVDCLGQSNPTPLCLRSNDQTRHGKIFEASARDGQGWDDEMMRCAICAIPPRCFPKHPTATSRQPSDAITSLPTIFYYLFKETTRKRPIIEMKFFSTRKHETQPKRPWGNWVFSNETMTLPPDSPGNNKKNSRVHETKRQNTK